MANLVKAHYLVKQCSGTHFRPRETLAGAMASNWWSDLAHERFWMETIQRPSFGDALEAPHTKIDRKKSGHYALLDEVRPGDVVLHWVMRKNGSPSRFAGWSKVAGLPIEVATTFYDGTPTTGLRVPLEGFTLFPTPLGLPDLSLRTTKVLEVRESIKARTDKTTYFPFYRHSGKLRAVQGGYLTKFPTKLFNVLPELNAARAASASTHSTEPRSDRRQAQEGGYLADAEVRRAIEIQAVAQARSHYESAGYFVEDVGASQPYDLRISHLETGAERHVEVKGSTSAATSVELTIGEVKHASSFQPTDLFVVSGIRWSRDEDRVATTEGESRLLENWTPSEDSLSPTRFRHVVPLNHLLTEDS